MAAIDQGTLAVVDVKHLAGVGPEIVDRYLRAAMAFLRCRSPSRTIHSDECPDMIGAFLFGFRRDRRQRSRHRTSIIARQ